MMGCCRRLALGRKLRAELHCCSRSAVGPAEATASHGGWSRGGYMLGISTGIVYTNVMDDRLKAMKSIRKGVWDVTGHHYWSVV